MLFVATSTQQLCQPWLDWGLMPYLACLYPLVLLLCLARSLRLLAPLTALATVCELFALAVVFYYILRDPLPPVSSVPAAASLAKFPVQPPACNTLYRFVFSYFSELPSSRSRVSGSCCR